MGLEEFESKAKHAAEEVREKFDNATGEEDIDRIAADQRVSGAESGEAGEAGDSGKGFAKTEFPAS